MLYKVFHSYVLEKEEVADPRKLRLFYLKIYSCKTHVLIKLKNDIQYQHNYQKLNIKAHSGFLLGY